MDDRRRLIEAIHAAPGLGVFAVTGGGATVAAELLAVPGASRTVLEVVVPYHPNVLADFLGHVPEHACSADTGRAMAARALARAEQLAPSESVFGLGVTASLATDRPKRGDHRFHLSIHGRDRQLSLSLTLAKGQRDRAGEEAVLTVVVLNALAEFLGVPDRLNVPLLPGEEIVRDGSAPADALSRFLRGESATVCQEIDGQWRNDGPTPAALLCGSFNPLHTGHRELAAIAARTLGRPIAFEISVRNVDKPELSTSAVRQRAAQFVWLAPLWLTRAPTYAEKVEEFPGCVFVVGADTAVRIVAPRYYGDDPARRDAALSRIRERGCRFLVAGRVDAAGTFVRIHQMELPEQFRDLFAELDEGEFRSDLSSTQLRTDRGSIGPV